MRKQEKGITLVALVITIIILLILAVVSVMAVTGTGLFAKTSEAVDKYDNSQQKENFILGTHSEAINSAGSKGSSSGAKSTDLLPTAEERAAFGEMSDGMRPVAVNGDVQLWFADYSEVIDVTQYPAFDMRLVMIRDANNNAYAMALDDISAQNYATMTNGSNMKGLENMVAKTWYSAQMESGDSYFSIYSGGAPVSVSSFTGGTVYSQSYLERVVGSF